MGMPLEKPKLFLEAKSFMWFVLVLCMLIGVRLLFIYSAYDSFVSKPFYYTYATVLHAYEKTKNHKHYQVLKLKSDEGLRFYTTSHRKENFQHTRLRLQLFPDRRISFQDYLGTFYVKSKIKKQENIAPSLKQRLLDSVNRQHYTPALRSFYNAIFFATPLEKSLRDKIALLGVSHLVALSGFHLGILWGMIYGLLLFMYRPLQQRYVPYRYALFDVGFVAVGLLGIYVWFVGYPPSLLRAYAMVVLGWGVLLMGIELLSFTFLFAVFLLLLLLFPFLLVSLGFWLSVAGVFYIFLLLHYSKHLSRWLLSLIVIPLGIFVCMLPVVHGVFGTTSSYQLLSPLLSILFIPFYPVSMVLHLLGMGGAMDSALLYLFNLAREGTSELLPWWILLIYAVLSIGAVWHKKVFFLLLGLAVMYAGYLFL